MKFISHPGDTFDKYLSDLGVPSRNSELFALMPFTAQVSPLSSSRDMQVIAQELAKDLPPSVGVVLGMATTPNNGFLPGYIITRSLDSSEQFPPMNHARGVAATAQKYISELHNLPLVTTEDSISVFVPFNEPKGYLEVISKTLQDLPATLRRDLLTTPADFAL